MIDDVLLEIPATCDTGTLTLQLDKQVEIKVSAAEAQRKVNTFVHRELSTQLHAETPLLIVGERAWWRAPLHLTFPSFGDVGLNQHIQPAYFARLTPYITYEVIEVGRTHGLYSDVSVWQKESPTSPEPVSSAVVITPAPVKSVVALEMPLRTHAIEIRGTATDELVTIPLPVLPVPLRPPDADAPLDLAA